MSEFSYLAAFFVGLAGSVHCLGMCGGIMSAFTFANAPESNKQLMSWAYNVGRICTYTVLGGIVGEIGNIGSVRLAIDKDILNTLSLIFMLLLALYISDIWKVLNHLEKLGNIFWRYIRPLSQLLIPIKSPFSALVYGMLWGFLPCGLIYSALTWSLASGDFVEGALMMLSFGIGTLPSLLIVSLGWYTIAPILQSQLFRKIIALFIVLIAIYFALYKN